MKKQLIGMMGLGIAFIVCCNGCKDKKTSGGKTEDDTTGIDISERHDSIVNHITPADTAKIFVITPENKDSVLAATTKEILTLFKNKDYARLDSFIHPREGVRFSPYATVDPKEDKKFTKEEFAALVTKNKGQKINWGNYDGSGNPILLSPAAYFSKFVYDGNFLSPQRQGVNKVLGDGNSINNLKTAYPGADFTENYLRGSKKNGGIDWKSVRLVYKLENGRYYLVGVVHDQWTI
ncbi:hypothetical protein [Niabella soli]|uniref:Uncharacterized protein n=1 Tax=Niabella soli DSM 19437 TaxID=929713 RepID=W0F386_9BACT|nr:hypothetical protein [Niabella soli]AHF16248.1 hypothetical protein NIASO_15960 [Niabella soli DSM 19437]